MSSNTLDEHIQKASQEADLYESTVHALLTFAAYVTHDGENARPNAFFGFGRRMDCTGEVESDDEQDDEGDHQPSPDGSGHVQEVTPDLVAQKSQEYGLVAEAKGGLAQGDDVWEDYLKRLMQYDQELKGWWTDTETIETCDALLLIHRSRSRQLVRFLERAVEAGSVELSPGTAVIEFVRSGQVDTFYSFSTEWGGISDKELALPLRDVIDVPLQKVLDEFTAIQFYDARPPLPMLLEILWGDFFGRIDQLEFDEKTKTWPLEVTVREVTEELQRAYGSSALYRDERSCEFPKESWIRLALEELVRLELATSLEEGQSYRIRLKAIDGDIREEFVRRMYQRRTPKASSNAVVAGDDQTTLPLDDL